MKTVRSGFEPQWREIRDYLAPKRFREHKSDNNDGRKAHTKIVDETALRARRVFVSGFVAGMTSPARPWFKLVTPDAELMESHSVKVWLEEVERRIRLVFQRSNFYQAIPAIYDDLGTFGTCAMSVLENFDTVAWFYPHVVGEYYVSANDMGLVDTVYRETAKTTRQLVEMFGIDAVSNTVKNLYNNDQTEAQIECVQAIEPNDDRIDGRQDFQNMPTRSVWFEKGGPADRFLGKRGFTEFPTMVGRWYASMSDDYGVDCPGMTALGGVKQLQHEQQRKAQAIDKMVNPPVQAPSSLLRAPLSLLPGGVTYYDEANAGAGIRPLYEMNPRINELMLDIQEVQQRINETFFVDMFLMISQQDDVRTATEIALRNEEKLLVLGPALQRVQTEILDPCIDRVFNIMARTDQLPDIPDDLEGVNLRVEYISMLAQAQQSVGSSSIERFLAATGNMAAVSPEVLDKVNYDEVIDEYANVLGVSRRILRADDEVAALRQARAQQQAAMQAAQMSETLAKSAKTASEINIGQDSAIQRLTSGV